MPSKEEGKYFAEYNPDHDQTCEFLEKMYSKQDADAYKRWAELWSGLAGVFMPLMLNPLISLADMLEMFSSQAMIRRMMFYSLEELTDDLGFVSDGPQAYFAYMTNDIVWTGPKGQMGRLWVRTSPLHTEPLWAEWEQWWRPLRK